jgi:hypothetical protein
MSTIKADAIEAATGTNTDLVLTGKGTGVPDIETGFKVSGTVGLPLSDLRVGTAGNLITYDASGDPAAVATGTATQLLTSNGAGAAPTFQDAPASGATLGTEQATTSGATITFTGIPAGTTRITIMYDEVSRTGSGDWTVEIGDSGGIETTGYLSQGWGYDTTPTYLESFSTTDFRLGAAANFPNAAYTMTGVAELTLADAANNTWVFNGVVVRTVSTIDNARGVGRKSLSGELTQVRIGGPGNFDAGAINISYS